LTYAGQVHSVNSFLQQTFPINQGGAAGQMFVCWWTIGYMSASVQKISPVISPIKWQLLERD